MAARWEGLLIVIASFVYVIAVSVAFVLSWPWGNYGVFIVLLVGSILRGCWLRPIKWFYLLVGVPTLLLALLTLTLPAVTNGRGTPRVLRIHQARMLASAIQAYKNDTGKELFPIVRDERTGMDVSWRVVLLPYLDAQRIADQYDPALEWNCGANLSLLTTSGTMYDDELDKDVSSSHFEIVARRHADGSFSSLLLVESPAPRPWTEPSFLTPEEFLAAYTRPESRVPWEVGIHRKGVLTDHGWLMVCVDLADAELIYCWNEITAEVMRILRTGDATLPATPQVLLPSQPWEWNRTRVWRAISTSIFVLLIVPLWSTRLRCWLMISHEERESVP